jgi:hypothetical protein
MSGLSAVAVAARGLANVPSSRLKSKPIPVPAPLQLSLSPPTLSEDTSSPTSGVTPSIDSPRITAVVGARASGHSTSPVEVVYGMLPLSPTLHTAKTATKLSGAADSDNASSHSKPAVESSDPLAPTPIVSRSREVIPSGTSFRLGKSQQSPKGNTSGSPKTGTNEFYREPASPESSSPVRVVVGSAEEADLPSELSQRDGEVPRQPSATIATRKVEFLRETRRQSGPDHVSREVPSLLDTGPRLLQMDNRKSTLPSQPSPLIRTRSMHGDQQTRAARGTAEAQKPTAAAAIPRSPDTAEAIARKNAIVSGLIGGTSGPTLLQYHRGEPREVGGGKPQSSAVGQLYGGVRLLGFEPTAMSDVASDCSSPTAGIISPTVVHAAIESSTFTRNVPLSSGALAAAHSADSIPNTRSSGVQTTTVTHKSDVGVGTHSRQSHERGVVPKSVTVQLPTQKAGKISSPVSPTSIHKRQTTVSLSGKPSSELLIDSQPDPGARLLSVSDLKGDFLDTLAMSEVSAVSPSAARRPESPSIGEVGTTSGSSVIGPPVDDVLNEYKKHSSWRRAQLIEAAASLNGGTFSCIMCNVYG